jgi:3-phenylpropionate/trans-cinnamate dioxygenase ferredoxin reductase subunit
MRYDGLVIATGSRPRTLPGADCADSMIALRTSGDAARLRQLIVGGGRVVIAGAGWIGAEVATAAAANGCETTVVEALAVPLATALPEHVGALTAGWYAAGGARLLLGERVDRIGGGAVRLVSGAEIAADVVVAGVGVRPDTDWLRGSGVPLTAGGAVAVDEGLRTGLPGVVAAGDCSAWWSRRYGRRMHVEHWDNALRGPAVAAASLLGRRQRYDPVPYFWSQQWGRMVQYAGHFGAADRIVRRGDPRSDPGWAMCWLAGSRLEALLTVDRPRDLVQGRKLMESGLDVDPARLADPGLNVKEAAASPR